MFSLPFFYIIPTMALLPFWLTFILFTSFGLAAPVYRATTHDIDFDHAGWLNDFAGSSVDQRHVPEQSGASTSAPPPSLATPDVESGNADTTLSKEENKKMMISLKDKAYRERKRLGLPMRPIGRPRGEINPLDPKFDIKIRDQIRQGMKYQQKKSMSTPSLEGESSTTADIVNERYKRRKAVVGTPEYAQQHLSDLGLDLGNVDWTKFKGEKVYLRRQGEKRKRDKDPASIQANEERKKAREKKRYASMTEEEKRARLQQIKDRDKARRREKAEAKSLGMSYQEYKASLKPGPGPEEAIQLEEERRQNKMVQMKEYRERKKVVASTSEAAMDFDPVNLRLAV
jgi:hypothetical protein